MQEIVYTMDVQYPLMVVGTAERHIQILNLNNPTTIFKVRWLVFSYSRVDPNCSVQTITSPLKWQTWVVVTKKSTGAARLGHAGVGAGISGVRQSRMG